jgi:AraC-like DNA-binding protein
MIVTIIKDTVVSMKIICHENPLLDAIYQISSKRYLRGKPFSFSGAPTIHEHIILNDGGAVFHFEVGGRKFEHDGNLICGKFIQVPKIRIRFTDATKDLTVIRLHPFALSKLSETPSSDFVDRVVPLSLEGLHPHPDSIEALIAAVDTVSQALTEDSAHASIGKIIDYIGTHFSELPRSSVRALSKQFAISESTLRRRFKKYTGISLSDFLITVKRRKMLQALFENNYNSLVVRESGYYDQSHFLNDFRRLYGTTLKHYKSKLQMIQNEDPTLMQFLYRCNIG